MSKTFGNLFGSKSTPVMTGQTPTAFNTLPEFGRKAFEEGVSQARTLTQDPSLFAPAEFTPDQQRAFEMARQGYTTLTPDVYQQQIGMFTDPYENQVVQSTLDDISRVGRGALSDIGASFSQGAFGGTRQAVTEAEMGRNIMQEAARAAGQLRSQGYQSAADRALSNIAQQNALQQQQMSDLAQLGAMQQQQAQAVQSAPLAANQYLLAAAQGLPTGGGGTQYSMRENRGALQRIGDASQGLATIGAFLSDARLKENIEFESVVNGFNTYKFNYKGEDATYVGVMAQEVLEKRPDAVIHLSDGYLGVDYEKIGVEFKELH